MLPSLYIHIPFCEKKCPFCSFAVTSGQLHRSAEYLDALRKEAAPYKGRRVLSLYVGGGTPSCLSLGDIAGLCEIISSYFIIPDGAERTFEVNPESLDAEKACFLKRQGFNRISLGVQSLNNDRLAYLGRLHSAFEAREAFAVARRAGFDNVSVDLMYGFPGQSRGELAQDMDDVIALGPDHLSVYGLTVEERSLFHVRKERVNAHDQAEMYGDILSRARSAGFLQYEVSNFARNGLFSRHNMNYWQGGEYIGLGMAAHSHLDGRRMWNADTLPLYLSAMRASSSAEAGFEILSPAEKYMEMFLFGLRMNCGVDLARLKAKMERDFPAHLAEELEALVEGGFLESDGTVIRATDKGRLVLDEISARLV
jgi:oxygen-independent coproporphyrinogen-3 oxidase